MDEVSIQVMPIGKWKMATRGQENNIQLENAPKASELTPKERDGVRQNFQDLVAKGYQASDESRGRYN